LISSWFVSKLSVTSVPINIQLLGLGQDYRIGTARKMSVDTDAIPDLLLLMQQKLCIVQYRYGSLSRVRVRVTLFFTLCGLSHHIWGW